MVMSRASQRVYPAATCFFRTDQMKPIEAATPRRPVAMPLHRATLLLARPSVPAATAAWILAIGALLAGFTRRPEGTTAKPVPSDGPSVAG